jgi:hypothetical protein
VRRGFRRGGFQGVCGRFASSQLEALFCWATEEETQPIFTPFFFFLSPQFLLAPSLSL